MSCCSLRVGVLVLTVVGAGVPVARGDFVAFDFTGSTQNWSVPAGVTSLHVSLWGGGGGGSGSVSGAAGSAGAYVTGDLSVTPLADLVISVGGGGGAGGARTNFDAGTGGAAGFGGPAGTGGAGGGSIDFGSDGDGGGGGGGYSAIFLNSVSSANALVVAGGGGGGGATAGSNPSLTAGDGTSLAGGTGGQGGAAGSYSLVGFAVVFSGQGGFGGGGAGGGINGGAAGGSGAGGLPLGLVVSGSTDAANGQPGGNGGPAGSLLSMLTMPGDNAAPSGSAAMGTLDLHFAALAAGAGGGVLLSGQNGRVVLVYSVAAVPEARAWLMLGMLAAGAAAARFAQAKNTGSQTADQRKGLTEV